MLPVLREPRLDLSGVSAVTPIAAHERRHKTKPLRHPVPQRCEMSGFAHEYLVAGRKRVHERAFPRARARRREYDDGCPGLENRLESGKHFLTELLKVRPAMVDRGAVDRAQNALGDVGRTWNLQEMTTAAIGHG